MFLMTGMAVTLILQSTSGGSYDYTAALALPSLGRTLGPLSTPCFARVNPYHTSAYTEAMKAGLTPRNESAVQATFETIYRNSTWGEGGGGSGEGSEIQVTSYARLVIELVMHKYRLRTLLDAPCGAMAWMPLTLTKLAAKIPCFQYTGMDVVRSVIKSNLKNYKDEPHMGFVVGDFTVDRLPRHPDLIFCRDALQHLGLRHVMSALQNFATALDGDENRYLLVGSYENGTNRNIFDGDFFQINLRRPPFQLNPTESFFESIRLRRRHPKELLLFSGRQLSEVNFTSMIANASAKGWFNKTYTTADAAPKRPSPTVRPWWSNSVVTKGRQNGWKAAALNGPGGASGPRMIASTPRASAIATRAAKTVTVL